MYKLDSEKAEEPEIKLPTSVGSERKPGNSRKTSASLTMLKPLTVWITTNWKILEDMGISRPPYLSPEKPGQEAFMRPVHGTMYMFEGVWLLRSCFLNPHRDLLQLF